MEQRSPFEIAREATPADALDAMVTALGEAGALRSINGLHWLGPQQFFGRAVTLRSLPTRPDHLQKVGAAFQTEHGMSPFNRALPLLDSDHLLVIEARGTGHFAAGGGTGLPPAFRAARESDRNRWGPALVLPGDYLFGNRDCIMVTPAGNAEEVLELAVVNFKLAQAIEKLPWLRILTVSHEVIVYLDQHCLFTPRQKQLAELYLTDEFH